MRAVDQPALWMREKERVEVEMGSREEVPQLKRE